MGKKANTKQSTNTTQSKGESTVNENKQGDTNQQETINVVAGEDTVTGGTSTGEQQFAENSNNEPGTISDAAAFQTAQETGVITALSSDGSVTGDGTGAPLPELASGTTTDLGTSVSLPELTETDKAAAPVVGTTNVVEPVAPAPAKITKASKNAVKAVISDDNVADTSEITLPDGVSLQVRGAFDQLQDYIKAMKPRTPLTVEVGARHQVTLYRSLMTILNTTNDDFNGVFSALLRMFHQHSQGVFNEMYVFRFMENVALNATERAAFQKILNMLKLAADPKGRAETMRQCNFESTLKPPVTEEGRNNVMAYFQR